MADLSKIGKGLPPYTFKVERVKIKEFVEAIGDKNPIYVDKDIARAQGYLDTPCPPSFITLAFQEFTCAYLKAFEEVGVTLDSVLHGEESYQYFGQIYPGDLLTCKMTFESIVEKQKNSRKMYLIKLSTAVSNQRGERVLNANSLIIEKK